MGLSSVSDGLGSMLVETMVVLAVMELLFFSISFAVGTSGRTSFNVR